MQKIHRDRQEYNTTQEIERAIQLIESWSS